MVLCTRNSHRGLENITGHPGFRELYLLLTSTAEEIPTNPDLLLAIVGIALNQLPPKYATSFIDKVNPRPHPMPHGVNELGTLYSNTQLRLLDWTITLTMGSTSIFCLPRKKRAHQR
ncbi:MAG: hypothetical protein VYA34_00300 [Myxococcota bacterium]|nr:hypothetical protein [Myxococcota bacterium]